MFSPVCLETSADAAAASPTRNHLAPAPARPDAADISSLVDTGEEAAGDDTAAQRRVRETSSEQESLLCGKAYATSGGAVAEPGAGAHGICMAAVAASTFSTAAIHNGADGQTLEEEMEEDDEAPRASPLGVYASQKQREENSLNRVHQQPVQQHASERNNEQQQEAENEKEDGQPVTLQQQVTNSEMPRKKQEELKISLETHMHARCTPLRRLQQQQAAARGVPSSPADAAPTEERFTATTAAATVIAEALGARVVAEATAYPPAAHRTDRAAAAEAAPARYVENASAAHKKTTVEATKPIPMSTTRIHGNVALTESEPGVPAGGVAEGKEVVDLLQQQAQCILETLRSDTQGCTYTETKRLDASLAQLQPKAATIQKMAEELRRMHQHTQELKAKTENNLLLIDRLKEEDKAFDEELAVLPEKLQSLIEYKATGKDELQALRTEYKLVSRQGEHALQAWEKKLEIYQHALGLRLKQSERGGPTLVEFVDLQPLFEQNEQQHTREQVQQQQDERLEQVAGMQKERKCCCFSFRLAEGGGLAEAWSFPPIELYGELAAAFANRKISLAFLVATMRRQFKQLLQQQHQQQRQLQRVLQQQQQRQRWQRQQHQQQQSVRRAQANAAAGATATALLTAAGTPVKANFPISLSAQELQQQVEYGESEKCQQAGLQLQKAITQEQTRVLPQPQHLRREHQSLQQLARHVQPWKQQWRERQQEQQHTTLIQQQQQPQQQQQFRNPSCSPLKTRTAATAASSWSVERQRSNSCNKRDFARAAAEPRPIH